MKNPFRLTLLLLVLLLPATAIAHDFEVDGICYNIINENEVAVTSKGTENNEYFGEMTLPSSVTYNGKTYSVTIIGDYAFSGSSLTSIDIPNSVTSIGNLAFSDCSSLTTIDIPNSVAKIGYYAFTWCSLTSITIPNSVTNIEEGTFQGCTALTSVSIGNAVTSIGPWAFSNCSALISITIPDDVTSIGEEAFSECVSMKTITIGNSVTSIGADAFKNCNELTKVYISDIEAWCKIDFQHVNSVPYFDFNDYTDEGYSNPLYYAGHLYLNGSELTDLTIHSESISNYAFIGCNLNSITFQGYSIGRHAFTFSSVKKLNSPNVNYIGNKAFYCSGLTSLTIPYVNYIGNHAFSNCSELKKLTLPHVNSIGLNAFAGSGLTNATLGNPNEIGIGAYAFGGCSLLDTLSYNASKCYFFGDDVDGSVYPPFEGVDLSLLIIGENVLEFPSDLCWNSKMTDLYCYVSDPSRISFWPSTTFGFSDPSYKNCTLHVPHGSLAVYQDNADWGQHFGAIVEMAPVPDFISDGISYKVIGENAVIVISSEVAYSGNVVIPETVTVDGVTYAVTGIGSRAFASDSLNFLTIPVSVTGNIASDAFEDCSVPSVYIIGEGSWADGALPASVDTLYISSNVTGVAGLQVNPTVIYSYAALPPTCDGNSFTGYDGELHVPASSLAAYFTEPYWSNFINIVSDAVEPTGLSLNNDSISIMVGNQITLSATVTPDNATPQQVFWVSTNDSIAKVGPINGELTALKAGECDIKATLLDKTVECHVIVTEIAPTEVTISQEFAKLEIGSQLTLTATVLPEIATDKVITWTTTNSDVATVDSLGNVMAMGQGECFITATCRDKQAMCHVIVVEHFFYITLDEHRLSLLPNHMEWLTPTVTPISTDLVVTSSNPSVAAARMANRRIQVVGITEGTTIIKVNSVDGYAESDSCRVTVCTQRGDVNYDGFINITDVTMMISQLMSAQSESYYDINADVNNDGEINISDVTRLISHLMTGAELVPKESPMFEDIEDVSKNATIHKTRSIELL